ncbi:hypothetical protein ANCCEY_10810 [Ancylostoma ceylanicum]|uniref:Reverse transcriptase domain-containing protein n=1 Tax=Ancylostoma ceylanicum TaxID=53326 RepID=A0A0D6LDS6_9BILA|nr:hypothetical protein ANCCEY_10810 [Ancylostoma ceylanicum]
MKQRRIRVLCLQETRWKGCKAKEIGDGIKLYYHGLATKNSGVAIAVAPPLKDHVSSVTRLEIRKWQLALADAGLKLNTKKTEVMSSTEEDYQVFDVSATAFAQAKEFQYLGSYLSADGTVDAAVRGRIKCAWLKWRESTGILCDRRCSRVLKGKIYRRVVRPTLMYGSECWPLSKTHERMLNTRCEMIEMRMLRWACGLTRCDRVPNEDLEIRKWQLALADAGLKLNTKKTEIMSSTEEDYQVFDVSETAFAQAKEFQYLGSYLSADGTMDAAVRGRIKCAWLKWRESTGILCDRRCSRVLKGKIYRRVVRPTLMYGSECWPLSKTHERMLNTRCEMIEMRMLRWACGLTRCDRVPNEDIRTIMQTAPIQLKLRAQRLRWYGHVMRRPSPHPSRQAMEINVT